MKILNLLDRYRLRVIRARSVLSYVDAKMLEIITAHGRDPQQGRCQELPEVAGIDSVHLELAAAIRQIVELFRVGLELLPLTGLKASLSEQDAPLGWQFWPTTMQTANRLGISVPRLTHLVMEGQLTARVCPDRTTRFNPSEIEQLKTKGSSSEAHP